MALQFPAQPYENQQVSANGNIWIWNGIAWDLLAEASTTYATPQDILDALVGYATEQYVQDQLDALVGPNPVLPTKLSDLTNDTGFITASALSPYATTSSVSGSYALKTQQFYLGSTPIAINRLSGTITLSNVNTDGNAATADVAAAVPASGITGTTLASNVVHSSLTSVGTLTNLTVAGNATVESEITATGNINANAYVVLPNAPTATTHATNKQYVDTRAIAFAVGMS